VFATLLTLIGQATPGLPAELPAPVQTGFNVAQTGFAIAPTPEALPPDPGFAFNMIDTIQKGGVVMIPMIMLSIFVFALIVERALYLRSIRRNSGPFLDSFFDQWDNGKIANAKQVAEKHDGPNARMLLAGIKKLGRSKEIIRESINEAALAEMPKLNQFLSTISVIGTMMPILGLLGTVSGMISTFEVITVKGTGDPKALAGGISEALITTQTGLIFALPIILLHTFLQNRVEYFVNRMEGAATRFLVQIESDLSASQNKVEKD
jgi:biopolymer transport protein ExbB